MKSTFATTFCLWLIVVPVLQRQDDNFLDLTKSRPPQRQRIWKSGGGASLAGDGPNRTPSRMIPLKVKLASLDKPSYKLGDQAIFEVALENVTNNTLVIPWSLDYDKVKPDDEKDPPGYVNAFLSLVIRDNASSDDFVASQVLYGSQLVRGSLKILRPGQRVRIRSSGTMTLTNSEMYRRVLGNLPTKFDVRARFNIEDRPFNPRYAPAISSNDMTVELRRREN